jgi:Fe-S-cluster containining protein
MTSASEPKDTNDNPRMNDRERMPTAQELADWLGPAAHEQWKRAADWIAESYPDVFVPEWLFGGKKHGWSLRYKKSKSFCTFVPEKGRFRLLIVFGAEERAKVEAMRAALSPATCQRYDQATTYHDGKWLLLDVEDEATFGDIQRLLTAKRKPASRRADPATAKTAHRRAIETDPARLLALAEAKADSHMELRAHLKHRVASSKVDALFRRLFQEVSREIDCTKCGNCCVRLSPRLHADDVERLAGRLGLKSPELEKKLLRKDDDGWLFSRQPCPLLEGKRCSCYADRPDDCRSYPHLDKPDRVSALLTIVSNAEVCPIVYEVLERAKVALGRKG